MKKLFLILIIPFFSQSQTLWQGETITFTKDDYADWTLEENQDRIADNVWITRQDQQGIFNIAMETQSPEECESAAPAATQWALGTIAQGIDNLTFGTFYEIHDCSPRSILNLDMVLKLVTENIYIDIKFLSWTSGQSGGGGGFSYQRSTPSSGTADILLDGIVSAENNKIKNVGHPNESNDAATKSYVDNRVSSVKFYGGWHENDNDVSSSSEITVGNLMFRKNESSNYLEVKEVSSADQTIIVIYSPFSNGNNYEKVGGPSGGSQYNTTEWKSIVQVYDSANSNYDLVPGSLTSNNAREYEIIERNNMSDPTTFSKYKIREYVDGYGQYVYSVEYYDFY